jgi:cytochrome b subunit of formate dehydrogenase
MAISERLDKTAVTASKSEPDYLTRFSVGQRIEHAVLMVTFIVLAVTGLSQRFYTADWAEWVILNLGGIENIRLIHRAFGFLFTLSLIYHLGRLVYSVFVLHSKLSMLPNLQDARDVITTLKYSLGFVGKPPQFGRFDYRQKFEYWGILFGGTIMIVTGFMLAFPLAFTEVLPGQFIAAAKEAHRNEAMLAVLTITVWHLYDVIVKPSIFPCDTSIFTGKMSRKRMIEEHPLEYAELVGTEATEETDDLSSENPPRGLPPG